MNQRMSRFTHEDTLLSSTHHDNHETRGRQTMITQKLADHDQEPNTHYVPSGTVADFLHMSYAFVVGVPIDVWYAQPNSV